MGKRVRVASGASDELHFYVDPRLAGKYKINLHLIDENNADGSKTVTAAEKAPDFDEETVSFPSSLKRESHYLCNVLFQRPEKKVFMVSAYLLETYLGRYALRKDFYFRDGSKGAARRCYERVLRAVRDLRQDIIDGSLMQNEIPVHLGRMLQGEAGEVEPAVNHMAVYLDPKNVPRKTSVGSENILTIPGRRSILEELGGKDDSPG